MSDLGRLDEAVRQFAFDIVMTEFGGDDGDTDDQNYVTELVDSWMEHWHKTGAKVVRDDLLANGQRVEPDYEAAARVMWDEDQPNVGKVEMTYRVVDAAIGDKLLIDPPTEEEVTGE